MNHEEARRLAEVALHWEGALHKALEDTGLNFMAKADLVRQIQAKLADGSTDLASALLEALTQIEVLQTGLELATRMGVELIMACPGYGPELDRDAKLAALAEIEAALSPGEGRDPGEEAK